MKVVLELKQPLTEKEIERLPLLLRDALGEFQTRRGVYTHDERDEAGLRRYFDKRYDGGKGYVLSAAEKIREIKERCLEAKKLHDAEVAVESDDQVVKILNQIEAHLSLNMVTPPPLATTQSILKDVRKLLRK